MKAGSKAEGWAAWLGLPVPWGPVVTTIARLLCEELTLQNEYLRLENKILKAKIHGRMRFTDHERRLLVKAALALGRKLMNSVVGIVTPQTILAWQRRLERQKWDYTNRRTRKPGRPRLSTQVESLICNLAQDNGWGYQRIQGELKKLDIALSATSIANILRRNGLPPAPDRTGLTWKEFLARHADVFLCADLFTQEIWTCRGLQRAFVFFVIHLQSRRILLAQATFSPHSRWLKQQVRHVLWACEDQGITPRFFLRDNDGCYSQDFDRLLNSAEVTPVKTPFQAPNANAHAERWVRSIRRECLDHLIIAGLHRLQHVLDQYKAFFNEHRPHQGIGNHIPRQITPYPNDKDPPTGGNTHLHTGHIECTPFLGGLLKSYARKAG